MVVFGWRTSIFRFYLLALLSAVLGSILAFGNMDEIIALSVYYLTFGCVLFATGSSVLLAYLHRNPDSQEETK